MSQSVQAVFRSLVSLEKTVEKCHIELDEQKNRLTFTLHCKHGISASLPSFLLVHDALRGWFQKHYVSFTQTHISFIVAHHAFIALYSTCLRFQNVCVGILSTGLLKTHNLSFQDSESLQAVFDKDSYANVFRSQPRSVKSFHILCCESNGDLTVFLSLSVSLRCSVCIWFSFCLVISVQKIWCRYF